MATECLDKTYETRMVCSSIEFSLCVTDIHAPVIAAQSIANIVKSSLGPMGLDKMLVDNIGVRTRESFHLCVR